MTDINPAITVIVCMYKGEATVCRMIDCVLKQTFKDFELILVDDGSPDRCGEIADEYSNKDNRVRVLHKPNGGLADARNHALDIARGEYTIQFDQDDWVELNCLEEMYAEAKRQDADMVICDYFHNDEYGQKYASQEPSALSSYSVLKDILLGNIYGYCWNKLVRLDSYRTYSVRFPLEFYGCEDQYGMCKLLKNDIKIAHLPKAFYHYVFVSGSLSRYYDDKTLQNDLKVREMFTSLFENSELRDLAFRCKSAAIYTRAFVLGGKLYSSKEFKQNFAEYYPYVRISGVYGLLYFMSRYGMYKVAYQGFELLFRFKQIIKKYSI